MAKKETVKNETEPKKKTTRKKASKAKEVKEEPVVVDTKKEVEKDKEDLNKALEIIKTAKKSKSEEVVSFGNAQEIKEEQPKPVKEEPKKNKLTINQIRQLCGYIWNGQAMDM